MAIISPERFKNEDIYLEYDLEEVMFRYDHKTQNIYRKFYGEQEHLEPIHFSNRLYCATRLYGDEITKEQYLKGRNKLDRPIKPTR